MLTNTDNKYINLKLHELKSEKVFLDNIHVNKTLFSVIYSFKRKLYFKFVLNNSLTLQSAINLYKYKKITPYTYELKNTKYYIAGTLGL